MSGETTNKKSFRLDSLLTHALEAKKGHEWGEKLTEGMSERGGSPELADGSPKAARLEEIALRAEPFSMCAAEPG